jgi:hypothetical protein
MGKKGCLNGGKVSGECSSHTTDFLTLKLKELELCFHSRVRLRGMACNKGQEHFFLQRIHCPKLKIRVKARIFSSFTRVQKHLSFLYS